MTRSSKSTVRNPQRPPSMDFKDSVRNHQYQNEDFILHNPDILRLRLRSGVLCHLGVGDWEQLIIPNLVLCVSDSSWCPCTYASTCKRSLLTTHGKTCWWPSSKLWYQIWAYKTIQPIKSNLGDILCLQKWISPKMWLLRIRDFMDK